MYLSFICICILLVTADKEVVVCGPGWFGSWPNCYCYENNTAYFGSNVLLGTDNLQSSSSACQKSCAEHPKCEFWTWDEDGPCFLKHSRKNVRSGLNHYISGSKNCEMSMDGGRYNEQF